MIFMLENVQKCALGVAFAPSEPLRSKKFQKVFILAFEANSALPRKNETKIVKITHSEEEGLDETTFEDGKEKEEEGHVDALEAEGVGIRFISC